MADDTLFDIVLFGYRNDIARARTLEFLDRLPLGQAGPARLDRYTGLPQRLFAVLPRAEAQRVRAELEELGAQVALVEVTQEEPHAAGYQLLAPAAPQARVPQIRPLTLVLVVALAASAYLWQRTQPQPQPELLGTNLVAQAEPLRVQPQDVEQPEVLRLNAQAVELAAAGEFGRAVDNLRLARLLAPNDAVLTRNLQAVLFNWGAAELTASQLEAASEHLQEAAALGERAEVLRALGFTHLREADYVQATVQLERALQIAPADTSTMLALAEAYLKQDKRPQALDLLHRAKEAGAGGPALDKRLRQLSREVDAEWDFVHRESPHFRLSFADDEDPGAVRLVLGALEDAYFDVGAKFGYYPDERTPVVLYTKQDFHTVTQTPDWAGAAFDGRIKLPVGGLSAADDNFPRVVRHEYAHSLVARLSRGQCPVWLNEGIAVWAEETEEGEREAWAERTLAGQDLFTLNQLNGSFVQLPAARAEVAYAQSYLAVRTLIDSYGARTISSLLIALSQSGDLAHAFAAVYPDDLPRFEERLLRQLAG